MAYQQKKEKSKFQKMVVVVAWVMVALTLISSLGALFSAIM